MKPLDRKDVNHQKYYSFKGAIHIHSRYSDGTGSLKQIVSAGLKSNLDFLIITDHNSLRLKNEGKEGWYKDKLFVMVGEEVSHSDQHLLALGVNEEIPKDLKPEQSSAAIQQNGGFGIVAHPDGKYQFHFKKRDYSWKYWEGENIEGLEVWSYMFDWVKNIKPWNLLYFYTCPDKAITGPEDITLKRWDLLNKTRRVVGIGGIDAHAKGVWPFQVFPYKQLFESIVTYVICDSELSKDNESAKEILLNRMRSGNCYFAYEEYSKAPGFRFWMEKTSTILEMGDRVPFDSNIILKLVLPKRSFFRILKDSCSIFNGSGKTWNMKITEPGVYRIEVFYKNKPWIYSNPIVLTG